MKKNNILYKTILSVFILIWMACEQHKTIIYPIPFEGEELIIYGFLSEKDSSTIQVYKTQAPLAEFPDYSLDAYTVNLWENSTLVQSFSSHDGSTLEYFYPYQQDKTYFLEVLWEEKKSTSVPIQMPKVTLIDSLHYVLNNDSSDIDIKIFFEDKEETYYHYAVEKYNNGFRLLEHSLSEQYETFSDVFSDETFENRKKEIFIQEDLGVFYLDENGNFGGYTMVDSIVVHLYTLSEEFFQFYESKKENNDGAYGGAFEANDILWTNFDNGYGFVGGVTKDSKYIKL